MLLRILCNADKTTFKKAEQTCDSAEKDHDIKNKYLKHIFRPRNRYATTSQCCVQVESGGGCTSITTSK